jgi:ABC-type dipeptide/oligopeptide/nickel transport system permease component
MIPTITVLGLAVGGLLSGAVLTETVFAWPGLGRFIVQSIFALDRAAVVGTALMITVVYSSVNLAVDVLVALLDPRIRYD